MRGQKGRAQLSSDDQSADSGDVFPGDLTGIQADDALLDALGGKDPDRVGDLVHDDLNALLLAWRHDVDSQAISDLVDTDTAVATIAAARPKAPSRHRFLIPLASAAAMIAIAFTGVSLVARDAQPGDALWGLTRVLYADHAQSIEAAVAVSSDLENARAALREGKVNEAKDALEKAGVALPKVSADDGHVDLSQKHTQLLDELVSTTATTANPSNPTSDTTTTVNSTGTGSSTSNPQTTSSTASSTTTPAPTTSSSQPTQNSSSVAPPPPPPEETDEPTEEPTGGVSPNSSGTTATS
ncbi:anti-sigma-D factor RsdA [Umezawaea endophytica]|uniref:Anti-sigma-D factor RsdA n=1 Tax=Umezawaea endophytica TaxID=1654476 RepID=A0A9X2VTX7_9PSEU|nr:anti-sigma-D factor RsdA [Umezawaea endophytica]MCS7482277.1 anti-sigma-D factor RsdA [Umezawaea endophytica]